MKTITVNQTKQSKHVFTPATTEKIEALQTEIKAIKQDETDKKLQQFLKSDFCSELKIQSIIACNNALNKQGQTRLKNTIQLADFILEADKFYSSEQFAVELQNKGLKFGSKENFISVTYGFTKQWYYKLLSIAKIDKDIIDLFFAENVDNCDYNELLKYAKNYGKEGEGEGEGESENNKAKTKLTITLKGDKNISLRTDETDKVVKGTPTEVLEVIKYLMETYGIESI